MSVIENEMYTLAVIGLLTTVISAFYYLRLIKIIYFDEIKTPFDKIKDSSVISTIFLSCIILVSYFLYPALLPDFVNTIFKN